MLQKRNLHGHCRLICAALMFGAAVSIAAQEVGTRDPIVVFNQAQDLHEKGDLAGAVKLYEEAAALDPKFAEAYYQLGVAELSLKHDAPAERAFRRASEIRPDWSLALAKLGQVLTARYIEGGSEDKAVYSEAFSILHKAIALDASSFPSLNAFADLLVHSPTAEEATIKELRKVITAATDGKANAPSSVWAARASLEERLGDRKAALGSLGRALAMDKNDKRALYQFASLTVAAGDTVSAKDLIDRYEAAGGDQESVHFLRAGLLAHEGNLARASSELDQIRRITPAVRQLRNRIELAKTEDAGVLEKKLEAEPKNSTILGKLCTLNRRVDPTKAIDYCRRAVEADPSNVDLAVGFGAALVQAKRYDDAATVLRGLIGIAPDNATAHANLATALFQLKRYEEAKIEYNWLKDHEPEIAATYYFLGIVHDQLGEYLDAMANYQLYLKKADPSKDKDQVDNVTFRLPALERLIKERKGKKSY